jgi:hypothetical protein
VNPIPGAAEGNALVPWQHFPEHGRGPPVRQTGCLFRLESLEHSTIRHLRCEFRLESEHSSGVARSGMVRHMGRAPSPDTLAGARHDARAAEAHGTKPVSTLRFR